MIPSQTNPAKPGHLATRSQVGQKRRFSAAGMTNIAASNAVLQALLALNAPVSISTLITQVFNACIGYITYGKYAFRTPINNPQAVVRYTAMAGSLWFANWGGIRALEQLRVPKTAGALIMILPLAIISYLIQLRWVFRQQ
jgi:putative flippase GtrA